MRIEAGIGRQLTSLLSENVSQELSHNSIQPSQLPPHQQQVDLIHSFVGVDDLGDDHCTGDCPGEFRLLSIRMDRRQHVKLDKLARFLAQ